MSDGASESVLYGAGSIDWSDPRLTAAAPGVPIGAIYTGQITASNINWDQIASFVIHTGGKEVLRITPAGELIFADASEAAEALLREWKRMRGE
jgi:hypothetical protein